MYISYTHTHTHTHTHIHSQLVGKPTAHMHTRMFKVTYAVTVTVTVIQTPAVHTVSFNMWNDPYRTQFQVHLH